MKANGILIYSKIDIKKNYWFIDELIKCFKNKNIDLKLVLDKEVLSYININKVDFAINRSRNFKLIGILENLNIRVFNNYLVNKIANDKFMSYLFFKDFDIDCMETSLDYLYFNTFPLVMKSTSGHGGNEVFLVHSKDEVESILKKYAGNSYVFQKLCSIIGKDIRVYMIKDNPLVAILRESQNDEFRSNYSLNHKANVIEIDDRMLSICKKITQTLNSDYIGIDFIYNKGRWVVNEIEDPVGAWMIYDLTNINLVEILVGLIINELNIN